MLIIEVSNAKQQEQFLDIARIIYKNDPNWVCPPDHDIQGIFDPKINSFYAHGKAKRWILLDEKGTLIGRVAAFINEKKTYTFEQPTGGMGFFECIEDQKAAFLLMDTCQQWLSSQGMQAMDGPINFGENDRYWGLLVHGYVMPGFGMAYNPPYYKDFFESYGFYQYFTQISNHLDITKPLPERFEKIAKWVMEKPAYSFDHLHKNNYEKFAKDFITVYNDAWQFHENFSPMSIEDVKRTFKKMSPIIEERFIWFAYHDGHPISFMIMVPDINIILQKLNGKNDIWAKLKFIYYRWRKLIYRARIIIMGVTPKFQKSGIESAIIMKAAEVIYAMPQYKEVELSWVGDFNPKMRALHESVGATLGKTYLTYRKLFDPESEAKRSSIIARDTKETLINKVGV